MFATAPSPFPAAQTDGLSEQLAAYTPTLIDYGVKVVGVLIALWVSFRIASWLQRRVERALQARSFDPALTGFFGSLTRWTIVVAAVLACLGVFGIQTTSFAALIGAAGLAVGLAFQGTLSNFASGVMLLVFRPFSIGDYVKVAGEEGVVQEIGLFTVALDTVDNRRVILGNTTVVGGTIENVTHNPKRRVDIDVGVSYDADLDQARKALEKAASQVEGRDAELGHQVFLKGLGASSVDFQVRVWCDTGAYWDVWQATVQAIKQALDAAGVAIPYPQLDVHLPAGAAPRALR